MKYKTKERNFIMYMCTMERTFIMYMSKTLSIKLDNKILEKEKYKLLTIARLTVFTRAFCPTCGENLLKGPVNRAKDRADVIISD